MKSVGSDDFLLSDRVRGLINFKLTISILFVESVHDSFLE